MSDIEKLRGEMEKITADMLRLLKSRTEIAKKIGIAASYLNDIEKTKRSAPKNQIIKKMGKSK